VFAQLVQKFSPSPIPARPLKTAARAGERPGKWPHEREKPRTWRVGDPFCSAQVEVFKRLVKLPHQ